MNTLLRAVSDWKGGCCVRNSERYGEKAFRVPNLYGQRGRPYIRRQSDTSIPPCAGGPFQKRTNWQRHTNFQAVVRPLAGVT